MRQPPIDVAVNVVRDGQGRVLLAERTARQVSAGYWELPGGKIDGGESAEQAARRELREEIGILAERLTPWIVYEYAFPSRRVRLHLFRVERWSGSPHGREGQRLAWVEPGAPPGPLLPSNVRALALLALPSLLLVTRSAELGGPQALLAALPAVLASGVRLIHVREPRLSGDQLVQLARRVRRLAVQFGATVAVQGTPLQARSAAAHGLHSSASALGGLEARPAALLWSVSCHDADGLRRAATLGADYAIVAPVQPAEHRAGLAPIGWDGLARMAAATPLPLYAQGGVVPDDAQRARALGAAGVAVPARLFVHGASPAGRGR